MTRELQAPLETLTLGKNGTVQPAAVEMLTSLAGGTHGFPKQDRKFEASLNYTRPCLKPTPTLPCGKEVRGAKDLRARTCKSADACI